VVLNTKLQEAVEVIVYYEIAIRTIMYRYKSKFRMRNIKTENAENNV
jgi:hypothetical protein